MKLIPRGRIAVLFLVLTLVTSGVLVARYLENLQQEGGNDTGNMTTSQNDTQTSDLREGNFQGSPEQADAQNMSVDTSSSSNFPFLTLIELVLAYLILCLGLAIGYRSVINTKDLRNLVNTSLKLAGYKETVGLLGREWSVEQITIQYQAASDQFIIYIPILSSDPREYGFRIGPPPHVVCSPEQLQMTLQVVNLYLFN